MSLEVMDSGELLKVPTQVSPGILERITTLEAELATLKQEVGLVKNTKATTDQYGLAKICPVDVTDVTVADGLVCGADEKNKTKAGTLANAIDALDRQSKFLVFLNGNNAKPIQQNEDLNNYTNIGTYTCQANAYVPTIKNRPGSASQNAFNLIVCRSLFTSSTYFSQWYLSYGEPNLFCRVIVPSTGYFGEWAKCF